MSAYTHILVAIDLSEEGYHILTRAREFSKLFGAKLTALHVVEYFPPAGAVSGPIELSEQRLIDGRDTLARWAGEFGHPPIETEVVIGNPTPELLKLADRLKVDLLIIGHHPHRGLSLLVSHTDAAVLNRASCDVLAVANQKPH